MLHFLYTLLLQIGFIPAFLSGVLEHIPCLDWINKTHSRPYLLTMLISRSPPIDLSLRAS